MREGSENKARQEPSQSKAEPRDRALGGPVQPGQQYRVEKGERFVAPDRPSERERVEG